MKGRLVYSILEWPSPTAVKEVRQFFGLTNFHRRFIKEYARIARTISDIVSSSNAFKWHESKQKAFDLLNSQVTSGPVLAHASSKEKFIVSTDASKYAVGVSLEQSVHPVFVLSHHFPD